jgi:hypothetical protein
MEAETSAGCDASKDIKCVRKLFGDLRFPITQPTIILEDKAGIILVGKTHNE